MTPPRTPRITVGPSQLASLIPPGMLVRRFTHNNDEDLVPGGTPRCIEIGTPRVETLTARLDHNVAALRGALGEIPGVEKVNILKRFLTIEAASNANWAEISASVVATIKLYFGWTKDPIVRTTGIAS